MSFSPFLISSRSIWLCLLALLPFLVHAKDAVVKTDEVQAELVAHAPDGVAPGKPLRLGLLLQHKRHWHTYWDNPGDSGVATMLTWKLPAGITVGEVEWPAPKRLPFGPLVNYGYEDTVLLPVTATVAPDFKAVSLPISLRADWLVCSDVCIPQSGEFKLTIPAQSSTVGHAEEFDKAQAALPRTLPSVKTSATVDALALSIDVAGLPVAMQGKKVQFFSGDAGVIEHAAKQDQSWNGDRLSIRVPLSSQRSASPNDMRAVITAPNAEPVALRFAVNGWLPPSATPAPPESDSHAPSIDRSNASLPYSLLLALLGGMLLNLMPCVFPVLSLKVIGFARHAHDRRKTAIGGLAYTAGVVLSFVALAAAMLALREAGDQLGWGFQLQSPVFVAALAILFALIGLNLLGVFQLTALGAGNLAAMRSRNPVVDHALTGVLAVVVASPCTAPFMGAALGVALTQPAPQALAVFAALGIGMALPYLAASLWPGLARVLPRPGAWMEQFKTAMAFPMFATVVWLLWVLGQQVGIDGASALLALIVSIAFASWVMFSSGWGRVSKTIVRAVALLIVVAVAAWTWPTLQLQQAAAARTASNTNAKVVDAVWQPWTPSSFAALRAEGKPVFVDFTAAWCVTCQFNKRTTLGNAEVMQAFRDNDVVLLRADWTRQDPDITDALRQLGRNGVPVYALYAPGGSEPQLLSEILSKSAIRDALAKLPNRKPA